MMDIWDEEMMAENEEYFNASSDENETVLKNKTDTTLKMLKSGLSKNTKKVMSTLREDTKGKGTNRKSCLSKHYNVMGD